MMYLVVSPSLPMMKVTTELGSLEIVVSERSEKI
jgi:hypothetical protein